MIPQRFVRWLYFDPARRICVGQGWIIETLPQMLALDWRSADRKPATEEHVMSTWAVVRGMRGDAILPSVNDMRGKTDIRIPFPPMPPLTL